MANQFIDEVNKAYEEGSKKIPGFESVCKFYDEYGKELKEKAKKTVIEIGNIRTGETPEVGREI